MKRKKTQAQQLIALAAGADLFHDPEGECWATIPVGKHKETWLIQSKAFRRWLVGLFYRAYRKPPQDRALKDAQGALEARAQYDGPQEPVHTRIAEKDGSIFLDLCNGKWEVVEITPNGWRIVADPPVKFRRARGMLPLPVPVSWGNIAELRQFVNLEDEPDWVLLVGWLLGALWPRGPYPALVLHGEHGSAKSTTARALRSLLDPNTAPLRSEPKDARDLIIAATNGWVVALDNLSCLRAELSDALCRLATGGGFGTRELFKDSDEVLFNATRPIILNGIEELATRSDLLDRTIILTLPEILEDRRRRETEFWSDFDDARPRILGVFLDALSTALRELPKIRVSKLPRMADFAASVTAAESALGLSGGTFLEVYRQHQESSNSIVLDSSPVAQAILQLNLPYAATCTELLPELNVLVSSDNGYGGCFRDSEWPQTAQTLSNKLRRLVPNLRARGISVEFRRGSDQRIVHIEKIVEPSGTSHDAKMTADDAKGSGATSKKKTAL